MDSISRGRCYFFVQCFSTGVFTPGERDLNFISVLHNKMPKKRFKIMIQRIQTIYLFLALLLITLVIFFPVTHFFGENGQVYLLQVWGIVEAGEDTNHVVINTIPLLILFLIILLLLLISIFSFKKRTRQLRLSIFTILLMIGSIVLIYFYRRHGMINLHAEAYFTIFAAVPAVSAVLTYLAFRGVKKDEELIRSYDRIR